MTLCRYFRLIVLFTVLLLTFYIYTTNNVDLKSIVENAPGFRINISIDTNEKVLSSTPQPLHQESLAADTQTLTTIDFRPIEVSKEINIELNVH